jgi:hypothetical protein
MFHENGGLVNLMKDNVMLKLNEVTLKDNESDSNFATLSVRQPKANVVNVIENMDKPKSITLSWRSLNVRIENRSLKQLVLSRIGVRKRTYKTILQGLQGVVQPGQMLALMGPR